MGMGRTWEWNGNGTDMGMGMGRTWEWDGHGNGCLMQILMHIGWAQGQVMGDDIAMCAMIRISACMVFGW